MTKPERYEALDVLRGLAALTVVLWHWQHFSFNPQTGLMLTNPADAASPLFWLLKPLYLYGRWGVDLFFQISGFVFYYLYAEKIRSRQTGVGRFTLLRFSRLYPLHLITLIITAGLQFWFFRQHNFYFVYQDNSVLNFFKHLFFASNWLPSEPYSFNGPAWSVSVEILLYAVFFITAYVGLTRPIALAVFCVLGAIATLAVGENVGRGLMSFFLGGLCWYALRSLREKRLRLEALTSIAGAAGALCVGLWLRQKAPAFELAFKYIGFPCLILAASYWGRRIEFATRPLAWIGNVSYSSYLIHFPLQLMLVSIAAAMGLAIDYASPWVLLVFFAGLIGLSLASYYILELPCQNKLRNRTGSAATSNNSSCKSPADG